MRYCITLSYNGTGLSGWQVQPDALSVQGLLEDALGILLHCRTKITGAGRTDAGVNAVGYVAHFDAENIADTNALVYKLNAILPPQITVHSVGMAAADFHARFDAMQREYRYYLHRRKDPFVEPWSLMYGYPGVDFALMNESAKALLGKHDFSCFEKTGSDSRTSICTVTKAVWEPYSPPQAAWRREEDGEAVYWVFTISADRFLRNMVRAIVGTLLEVGRGRRSAEEFSALVLPISGSRGASGAAQRGGSRSAAGESVPGKALFLSRIEYPEGKTGL